MIGCLCFLDANLCDKARKLGIPVWRFGEVARGATFSI